MKWQSDIDAARAYSLDVLRRTAKERGWSADLLTWAEGIVRQYADAADGWFTDDVPGFWVALGAHFTDVVEDGSVELRPGVVSAIPNGVKQLAHAFRTAANAAKGTAEFEDLSSVWGLTRDTAAASARDAGAAAVEVSTTIREAGKGAAEVARAARKKWVIGGLMTLGAVGIGAAVFARVRG